ncbi:hypothetical protein [Suicoccus acidiformans]|uniref:hypothetical protein n=1 Tax=Suicoccus acidiformans TaxID=2036206 RepID=UPI0013C3497C|nr:hypothetical protein [Suicoccus acidiformans]
MSLGLPHQTVRQYPVSNPLYDEALAFAEIIQMGDQETCDVLTDLIQRVNKVLSQLSQLA